MYKKSVAKSSAPTRQGLIMKSKIGKCATESDASTDRYSNDKLKRINKRPKQSWAVMDMGTHEQSQSHSRSMSSDSDNVTSKCQPGILFSDVVSGKGKPRLTKNLKRVNSEGEPTKNATEARVLPKKPELNQLTESDKSSKIPVAKNLSLHDKRSDPTLYNTKKQLNLNSGNLIRGLSYAAAAASANRSKRAIVSPRVRNHRELLLEKNDRDINKKPFVKSTRKSGERTFEVMVLDAPKALMPKIIDAAISDVAVSSEVIAATPAKLKEIEIIPEFTDSYKYLEFHMKRMQRFLIEQEGEESKLDESSELEVRTLRPLFSFIPIPIPHFTDRNYETKERNATIALNYAILQKKLYTDK